MSNSMGISSASIQGAIGAQNSQHSLNEIKLMGKADERTALELATRQFEGLFIQMMLKSMRSTVGENAMFSSSTTKTFQDMQDTEMAKQVAANGGLGLTQQIIDSVMQQANLQPRAKATPENVAPQNIQTFLQTRGVVE